MKKIILILFFSVFLLSSVKAQDLFKIQKTPPVSIYTINAIKGDKNGFYLLNKKLNIGKFHFVFVNQIDIDTGFASIALRDIGKKPTTLILDDYKSYYDNNFLKGFLLKYDPTRTFFHSPSNSVQPSY